MFKNAALRWNSSHCLVWLRLPRQKYASPYKGQSAGQQRSMWQRGENRQLSSNQKQKKLNLSTRQRGRSAITSNHQYQAFNMVWSNHKLLDGMTPFPLFRLELWLSLVRPEPRAYRQLLKLLEEPRSMKISTKAYLQHCCSDDCPPSKSP